MLEGGLEPGGGNQYVIGIEGGKREDPDVRVSQWAQEAGEHAGLSEVDGTFEMKCAPAIFDARIGWRKLGLANH